MKNLNLYGAGLIIFVAFLTSVSNTLTHSLPCGLSPYQILFFKSFIGWIILLIIKGRSFKKMIQTKNIFYQLCKGIAGTLGNIFWLKALQILPLANSSGLSLTSSIITTLGAKFFFKEKITPWMILALFLCVFGISLIIQPSFYSFYSFFPLLSAIAFSCSSLLVKKVSLKDSSVTTLFYLLFFMAVLSSAPAFLTWFPCSFDILLKILGIGILYVLAQLCLIEAYTYAVAGFLAPFKFVRFPFAIMLGWFFFNENTSLLTLLGGGSIIFSCLLILNSKNEKPYKEIYHSKNNL